MDTDVEGALARDANFLGDVNDGSPFIAPKGWSESLSKGYSVLLPSVNWYIVELMLVTSMLGTLLSPRTAEAVRPFVTDDARIVYQGQIEVENYAGVTLNHREKPSIEARSLQGTSVTDRLEIIAGGFGFNYQGNQARPLDMLIQPKYVLYRSFGAIPSISVAAATLFPLSGNRQQWNSYAMAHASWFLFNLKRVPTRMITASPST